MSSSRLAVMAHYDPRGQVGPHVHHQAASLAEAVDKLVIVSTAQLTDRSRAALAQYGEVVERANYGYDFFSYKIGLENQALAPYDEVIICNDTYVGPLRPYSEIFAAMATRPVDFWGFSESRRIQPHLQSFFLAFRSWAVQSRAFQTFWARMSPISDRLRVIRRYEIGISKSLTDAGFTYAPYFVETPQDRKMAHRRVSWWTAHQRGEDARARLDWWRQNRAQEWNPAVALADRALLDARLPYVKLDTLRYDPYGLNARHLLTLCEEGFPQAFEGVRSFIDTTSTYYRPREKEVLHPTPAVLKPFRPMVEYRRAP